MAKEHQDKTAILEGNGSFVSDMMEIRRRARRNMEQGPVTDGYRADRKKVIAILNEVLATEIVCILRYKRHYFTASGLNSEPIAAEFLQHANEEQTHADMVARRIIQLQGEPNFNPEGLATRSHSEYAEGANLVEMIKEDLVAERVAVQSYTEIIRWLGESDPTTRRVMETLLEKEEEHADDMANLLATLK